MYNYILLSLYLLTYLSICTVLQLRTCLYPLYLTIRLSISLLQLPNTLIFTELGNHTRGRGSGNIGGGRGRADIQRQGAGRYQQEHTLYIPNVRPFPLLRRQRWDWNWARGNRRDAVCSSRVCQPNGPGFWGDIVVLGIVKEASNSPQGAIQETSLPVGRSRRIV